MPRTCGCFADRRAILLSTVKPRLILLPGSAVVLDGAGQVLAKPAVEEIVVVANLETGFGEEIREILF